MKKIIIMSTISYSIRVLIKSQPYYLSQFFDEVELAASDSGDIEEIIKREKVTFSPIDMERRITPFKDLKTLFQLIKYFKKSKPDVIYSFTPKGGLLCMIAGFFSGVPTRIHNVVGMPLMEAQGKKRTILTLTEKATYYFSTHVYCNSVGLKKYINEHLTNKPIKVIGHGSINGVDCDFYHNNYSINQQMNIKQKLGFEQDDFVLSFMGRIVRDKGVNELVTAFKELNENYPKIKLLIVGKFEEDLNPIDRSSKDTIENSSSIKLVDFQNDLREYMAASDLFILPSYREGLPNSLIEAGAFGIPLIATDINGCNEIILHEENGLLVEKKSATALYNAIELLYKDRELYMKLKSNVRDSIVKRFEQKWFLSELKNNIIRDAGLDKK